MVRSPVADRIEARMKELGFSNAKVTREAELSRSFLNDIFKGKSQEPRLSNIEKIAKVLECSTEYLLGKTSQPQDVFSQEKPALKQDEAPETIGPPLLALCKAAEVTLDQVAVQIGTDPIYLAEIASGHATPSWPLMCRLADYFQVGTEFFRPNAIQPVDVTAKLHDELEMRAWLLLWHKLEPSQRTIALRLIREGLLGGNTSAQRA